MIITYMNRLKNKFNNRISCKNYQHAIISTLNAKVFAKKNQMNKKNGDPKCTMTAEDDSKS